MKRLIFCLIVACASFALPVNAASSPQNIENPCTLLKASPSRAIEDACALYLIEKAASADSKNESVEPKIEEAESSSVKSIPSAECDMAFGGSQELEKGHRTFKILGALIKASGLKKPVGLCVYETGENNKMLVFIYNECDGTIFVGSTRYVYAHFSDGALRGFLAHELGHSFAEHSPLKNDSPEEMAEADAYAICLDGEEGLRDGLTMWGLSKEKIDDRLARAQKYIRENAICKNLLDPS
ncbi:MAG: hypothetical protein Q7S28_04335 [bacterium]|nr:hypothetical protein [bacterium]